MRLIAVALALGLATSAQAMLLTPLHQPDGMITQVREARQVPPWPCAWNVPGQVRIYGCPRCGVNGICMLRVPPLARHPRNRRPYEYD